MPKQGKTSPNTLSFIDVSPPNETHGLTEAIQRLNATLARDQAEKDREGRELQKMNGSTLQKDQKGMIKSIPRNGKYKFIRRMAKKFSKSPLVDNWKLASCIYPTLINQTGNRRKFVKKDYINNKAKYDKEIKSRLKSLNRLWRRQNQEIKFHQNYSELTMVQ